MRWLGALMPAAHLSLGRRATEPAGHTSAFSLAAPTARVATPLCRIAVSY